MGEIDSGGGCETSEPTMRDWLESWQRGRNNKDVRAKDIFDKVRKKCGGMHGNCNTGSSSSSSLKYTMAVTQDVIEYKYTQVNTFWTTLETVEVWVNEKLVFCATQRHRMFTKFNVEKDIPCSWEDLLK